MARRFMNFAGKRGRQMRCVLRALLLVGLSSPALADDFDMLRGSQSVGPATFTRWSGFYAGGDFAYTGAIADFSRSTGPLIAASLQDTVVQQVYAPSQLQMLGSASSSALGFGGFLGYNIQWQDLITSVEATYTHSSLTVSSSSSTVVSRNFTPPSGNVVDASVGPSTGRLSLTDYGELRARAGYVVGNLLPYGFVGFAVGIANYSVSTNVDLTCTNATTAPYTPTFTCAGFPQAPGNSQNNMLAYGVAAGGGLEWAVTPNIFLRSELEIVEFPSIAGIPVSLFNARVGAGFKF
jgi:outer membrane immunogenic protein